MNGFLITHNHNRNSLFDLRREMDRLFEDFWHTPRTPTAISEDWRPACDIEEQDDCYLMTFEMPGIPKDNIKIECVDNQITVSGERSREPKNTDGFYSERRFGKFSRSFTLPAGVNSEKVEANYEDGILRLYVPKSESARPRQIKISNGSGAGFFGKLLGQSTPNDRREKEVHSFNGSKQ